MHRDDMSYFEDPEFMELLERYEQSLEQGGALYMDAEDLTDIAEYYMMHNEEEKANQCIATAVRLHPDATDPQVFLARQQLFHGNIPAAYGILYTIENQDDREVIFLRIEILLKERKVAEAVQLIEATLEQVVDERDAFLYDVADILFEYEQYEESLRWAEMLMAEYPCYPDGHMLMADVYSKLGRYNESRAEAEKILDKDAFHQGAWIVVAESYAMQDNCEASLEATEYLLAINERHHEAMLTRASNLFYLNRIEEAHEQYQAYLALYPDEYAVLYLDGICLANIERYDESRDTLLHALDVSTPDAPECIHIHLQLTYVYSKLHQLDLALDHLEMCQQYPQPEAPIDYDLARGHVLLENGFYEEAEEAFDQAIKASRTPYDTLLLIGITLGETGHYTKAADIFQSLHDSTMEKAEERTSPYLAYCHLFLNHRDMYLQFLQEAAKLNPNTTQFLFSQFYPGVPVSQYYEMALKGTRGSEKNPPSKP